MCVYTVSLYVVCAMRPCVLVCLQGHVVMGTQAVSVYQQVMEKTKGLSFKSQMLAMNLEKKFAPKSKDSVSIIVRYTDINTSRCD